MNREPIALEASARFQRWFYGKAVPLAVVVLTFGYALLTQPFRIPDEFNHFFRAYQVSEGVILGRQMPHGFCGDELPASLQEMGAVVANFPEIPKRRMTAEAWRKGAAIPLDPLRRIPTHFPNYVLYSPLVYAPAAAAVMVGRWLEQPPLYLLYFGRLASALVAAALVILALRRMPFQRDCLWVVACLPMALSLMGSVSADAMIFPLAFFWFALVLAFTRSTATPVSWCEGGMLLVAAVAVGQFRPPFSLLALLALEPRIWRQDFNRQRRFYCLAAVGLLGLTGAIWFMASRHLIVPMDPNGLTNSSAQFDFVMHHPFAFLATLGRTLAAHYGNYWQTMIGVLGWVDTPLPAWIRLGLSIALVVSTMFLGKPGEPSRALRWFVATLAVATAMLIFLALYQVWSPVGDDSISGIQGRYFITLLPLAGIAFSSRLLSSRPYAELMRVGIFILVVAANIVALWTVATAGAA
jgi:uncharacterized membrane protein